MERMRYLPTNTCCSNWGICAKSVSCPQFLVIKVYFSSLYEVARPYKTQNPSLNGFPDLPMDVAAGMLVETLFGPVYIGGSWGDSGHRKIFFKLGRVF